jgi:hypothetical protein
VRSDAFAPPMLRVGLRSSELVAKSKPWRSTTHGDLSELRRPMASRDRAIPPKHLVVRRREALPSAATQTERAWFFIVFRRERPLFRGSAPPGAAGIAHRLADPKRAALTDRAKNRRKYQPFPPHSLFGGDNSLFIISREFVHNSLKLLIELDPTPARFGHNPRYSLLISLLSQPRGRLRAKLYSDQVLCAWRWRRPCRCN